MAKWLDSLNLGKNELQNARIHLQSSDPGGLGSSDEAYLWYNSTSKRLKFYSGSAVLMPIIVGADFANADIPLAKLAVDPLARANHTGTQTASTISDLATVVKAYRLDEFAAPTASVSFGTQLLTNLATPVSGSDAATKTYVDNAVAGLSWKEEVRAASTAPLTLATGFENGDTVDGVTLATGDRILIKDQAAGAENGIYTVNASGAPTRSTDADSDTDIRGAAVFVANGTTNGGTRYVLSNTGTITLGSTTLTFVQFGGGATYTAGNGLTLSGNDFNVGAGTGITVNANDVAIDTAVTARYVITTITGNGSATSFNVDHNLGQQFPTVTVWESASPNEQVYPLCVASTTNRVIVSFGIAPANLLAYKVVVAG